MKRSEQDIRFQWDLTKIYGHCGVGSRNAGG